MIVSFLKVGIHVWFRHRGEFKISFSKDFGENFHSIFLIIVPLYGMPLVLVIEITAFSYKLNTVLLVPLNVY